MNKKLYVGNLSFSTTSETLSGLFAQIGSVISCNVITDRDSGRSKGFGFVEMSSAEEAQMGVDTYDGTDFDGRQLRVNEAKPQGFGGSDSRGGRGGRYSEHSY